MPIFKVNRYEQIKVWQSQYIFFEAKNLNEAKKLAQEALEDNRDIAAEIVDWGDYDISFETEEATGNYDWTDEDIDNIEECK